MNETVKIWLEELYKKEIEEAKGTIENEHIWELGYDGDEPLNPHTENIEALKDYIEVLEEKLGKLKMKKFTIKIIDNKVYINDKLCECSMPMDRESREDDLNKRAILALANEMGYEAIYLFEEMADSLNEMLGESDD